VKTAISLPDSLFKNAERLAVRLGLSRSQLYARAINAFISRCDADAVTARLNEVYADEPSGMDPVLLGMQVRSLGNESW